MKTALLTLSILAASQSVHAASCETHFKRQGIENQKIQRNLDCDLIEQSNETTNEQYMNHDRVCVTEYTAADGNTVSSLSFIKKGDSNLNVQVKHMNSTLDKDVLRVVQQELVNRGGIFSIFYKQNEIIIKDNSSKKPSLILNFTEGHILGNYETVYAGSYTCKKTNSIFNF
jgi:hypothetical protein